MAWPTAPDPDRVGGEVFVGAVVGPGVVVDVLEVLDVVLEDVLVVEGVGWPDVVEVVEDVDVVDVVEEVEVVVAGPTKRTRSLLSSAINTAPADVIATALGVLRLALVAGPPSPPKA